MYVCVCLLLGLMLESNPAALVAGKIIGVIHALGACMVHFFFSSTTSASMIGPSSLVAPPEEAVLVEASGAAP